MTFDSRRSSCEISPSFASCSLTSAWSFERSNGAWRRRRRLGLQHAALQRDLEVHQLGFRRLELGFGVHGGLLDVGIR
jgi:hypothetical protein